MKNLRIVFMGTPEFAVTILDKLVVNNCNVVGVITAPDRPAGRGRKLNASAVKKYAEEKGLNLLQPTNLKNPDFVSELKSLNANLQVVVAFRMLPKIVWQMPEFGTFNLHASLLPQYRGAAPINWAIINGETETGVTTFFIDDKIDTGEVILCRKAQIDADESAGNLHDRLMHLGADLVLETVEQIEKGKVSTTKQPETGELKSAYKIHKDTCKIDWNANSKDIYNLIRGLSPYPAAWTTLYNGDEATTIKIYKTEIEGKNHEYAVGKLIFDRQTMKVAVDGGFVVLHEIQLSGKRKMSVKDVLNGLKLSPNAYFY